MRDGFESDLAGHKKIHEDFISLIYSNGKDGNSHIEA